MFKLVDPDAATPYEPKFAFWRHWALPGLQLLRDVNSAVGKTKPALTEYPISPLDQKTSTHTIVEVNFTLSYSEK
ncbi:hypothetical protein E5D57_004175 [Metarhizium anisopliae]|nr:hypothetical protein E5D57_004175 [Metarhizium anisopliae]